MSGLLALSLSIGSLGALATWLALSPLAGIVTIWGIFIGWGAFFHNGADMAALRNTMVCGVFGSLIAGVAFALITKVGLGADTPLAVNAALWVGVTAFVMVLASKIPAFAAIPTSVYGYAATAAYAIHAGEDLSAAGNTLMLDLSNPVIVISASIVLGALFGLLSGKLSAVMTSE